MSRDPLESYQTRAPRRGSHKPPSLATTSLPSRELAAARAKAASEIASLVHLAELDAHPPHRAGEPRAPLSDDKLHERRRLTARLAPETIEAYNRALRAGRQPAVVRLVANVCSGCHVRLHSTLEQKVRRRHGIGSCPHCLRIVYDPEWLHAAAE